MWHRCPFRTTQSPTAGCHAVATAAEAVPAAVAAAPPPAVAAAPATEEYGVLDGAADVAADASASDVAASFEGSVAQPVEAAQ